ncbi:MAG: DUF6048 family protein [Flavobacteriales bacterium]
MKTKLTVLFCISFLYLCNFSIVAQENSKKTDSISYQQKYGIRVGLDLAKPIRTLLDKKFSGFEVMGDFRISNKFFIAAELGSERKDYDEPLIKAITSGSYLKLGFDFNAYNNWLGMNNAISAGLRYGFSTFKQELLTYSIYTGDDTYPETIIDSSEEFKGLTAHWAELIVAIKTEILTNLFLSVNVQLKRKITEDKPTNFDNLYIPGFHKTNDFSEFGVGYGYTLSYLIPIFKKK